MRGGGDAACVLLLILFIFITYLYHCYVFIAVTVTIVQDEVLHTNIILAGHGIWHLLGFHLLLLIGKVKGKLG